MTPLDFSSYPYSHSLVALLVWASIFASLYMALSHSELRVAIVIVTLIFSHWVLDVLSHRPDMPITLGEAPKTGVGQPLLGKIRTKVFGPRCRAIDQASCPAIAAP